MITQISWIKPPDLSNLNHNNRNSIKSPAGHTHTINFFDLALPTVLLTRLPQCKPGSLAHSNYKLNPAAVTHHCLAELASRIAEWPGDSDHPAQIIRRTTSMCSPTYLIAAAMIPWSSLSMPAYLAMISSRSIPSNFMTSNFNRSIHISIHDLDVHQTANFPNHELKSVCGGRSSSPIPSHGFDPFLLFRRWCAAMASLTRAQLVSVGSAN